MTGQPVYADGRKVGQITSAIFSPDFNINVSIGMVADSHWDAGTKLEVETQDGMRMQKYRRNSGSNQTGLPVHA